MNKEELQPLKIVLGIRVASIAFLVLAALIMTFTCIQERHSTPADYNTASLTDTTCLTSIDTVSSEMKMAAERAIVLNRARDIYQLVRNEYIYSGGCCEFEWFDRAFCSKSWNNLLMKVRCKEEETGTYFFEVDRWSMMRYPGPYISFEEFEVDDLWMANNHQKRATVSFVVYDDNTYTPARVDFVYENNSWKIDNFHNLRYMLNLRNCMWDYVLHDIV